MPKNLEPLFQSPGEMLIELPPAVYPEDIGESEEKQFDYSYGKRDRNWKVVKVVGGVAVLVTVAGLDYFRRNHGEEK